MTETLSGAPKYPLAFFFFCSLFFLKKVTIDTKQKKMKRPSYRELNGKLREAKGAVSSGCIRFVEPVHVYSDLLEIDILVEDLPQLLVQAIEEIGPADYKGTRPPQRSYETSILNCELFAFSWASNAFGFTMYFKFALKEACVWIVSLHKDRSERKGG